MDKHNDAYINFEKYSTYPLFMLEFFPFLYWVHLSLLNLLISFDKKNNFFLTLYLQMAQIKLMSSFLFT